MMESLSLVGWVKKNTVFFDSLDIEIIADTSNTEHQVVIFELSFG